MENIVDFGRTYGQYLGGSSYECTSQVAINNFMYVLITNNTLTTYTGKYTGTWFGYVPVQPGSYLLHKGASGLADNARFVGIEIQSVGDTEFRFNWVRGYLQGQNLVEDRYTDSRIFPMGAIYKFSWYTNTQGTNDTFWVNNVSHSLSTPTITESLLLNHHIVFDEDTPVGYRLSTLAVSYDPTLDPTQVTQYFNMAKSIAPFYTGTGTLTPNNRARPISVVNDTSLLMNHATKQAFVPNGTVNYIHRADRMVIA